MATRAEHIVREAARLFAERGYGATSIDEIGVAAGVSGPAVYWHFHNKQAVLAAILVDISERLLDSGRRCVDEARGAADALDRLIDQQVTFALDEPDLIVVHSRELHHLDSSDAHRVRRLQRQYVDLWVGVLALATDAPANRIAAGVQATIGLINSTPHLTRVSRADLAPMLRRMALQALSGISSKTATALFYKAMAEAEEALREQPEAWAEYTAERDAWLSPDLGAP